MKELHQEFHNQDPEHFTNYDYILQLSDNGQYSPFKEFIKELSSNALLTLIKNNKHELKTAFYDQLSDELLSRTK